ncbi:hypothetical protein AK812_SmicGene41445 [Symbiodinium microadriaticum]|uniref:Uncharacterized protein n=1 Tax=Symbiodinium microadriaticum TaxID=2951 RepID=A0A1Q9C628_SYMMI|nr:hypothetical protein AK812_SmicGene41445 [Symbiodinium microadriaticum]
MIEVPCSLCSLAAPGLVPMWKLLCDSAGNASLNIRILTSWYLNLAQLSTTPDDNRFYVAFDPLDRLKFTRHDGEGNASLNIRILTSWYLNLAQLSTTPDDNRVIERSADVLVRSELCPVASRAQKIALSMC